MKYQERLKTLKISKEQLWGLMFGLILLSACYSLFFLEKQHNRNSGNPTPKYSDKQIEQEIVFANNAEDKRLYLQAITCLKNKHYISAYEILSELEPRYINAVFGHSIMLRLSDCIFLSDFDSESAISFDIEKGLNALENILDSNMYSPVLYQTFRKWRAQTQAFWYGMSNMSKIPNNDYNMKRQHVINTIKEYYINHPEDEWAKIQLELLSSLPDIDRGGPFGNNVLSELSVLYPM